jgi:hypothetical protein
MPPKSDTLPRMQLLTLQAFYLAVLGLICVLEDVFPSPEFMYVLCALVLVCNAFYLSHFVVPFATAFVLWRFDRNYYWSFVLGLTA